MKDLNTEDKQEDRQEGSGQRMGYRLLPELFLRAPFYGYMGFDLDRMPEVLADPFFRNALYLASPGFYRVLERKGFVMEHLLDKERISLYKYYNRMCFRPVPFGGFATFTLLKWMDKGPVLLKEGKDVLLHLRPDQQLISAVNRAATLTGEDFGVRINPLLYRLGKEYRLIGSQADAKGKYGFSVDAFEGDKFYTRLFRYLGEGTRQGGALVEWIRTYAGCTAKEAAGQLALLLEEQVLISAAQGAVITEGQDPFPAHKAQGKDACCERFDVPLRGAAEDLAGLAAGVQAGLPAGAGDTVAQVFYAAAERPLESGGPPEADRLELERAIRLLQRLSLSAVPLALENFIAAFKAKFDREPVPLLLALDPDAGIAYQDLAAGVNESDELLKNLRFPAEERKNKDLVWTAVHRLLFRLWAPDASRDAYAPLHLAEGELQGLETPGSAVPFPPSACLLFRDAGDYLLIEQAGGATATALVGRFSLFSEEVAALCRRLAGREMAAQPDVVFADIGQLSDTHVDNVNRRRKLYPYEIPLNVYSALPEKQQLLPGDLWLSLRNGELVLTSARLNKRVIPRLATAYNYQHNELGVFRLLCDLQYQGLKTGLNLDLEAFFPGMDFYPRVYSGRVILSLAKWRFKREDLAHMAGGSVGDALCRLRAFRERYHIPQRVSLGSADQQLVFDLGHAPEAFFFLECLRGLQEITLTEYILPGRSVKAGHEVLAGQYVGFLCHDQRVYRPYAHVRSAAVKGKARNFKLGSEWLYLKIYCTPLSADRILMEVVAPVVRKCRSTGSDWFFVRYTDPAYHLRLRFRVKDGDTAGLLKLLERQLKMAGTEHLVKELQGDTYRRELERYPALIIDEVEMLFRMGSEYILRLLTNRLSGHGALSEFDTGLVTALGMAAGYLGGLEELILFFSARSESFLAEFRADKKMRLDLDLKFRELRQGLENLDLSDLLSGNKCSLTDDLEEIMRQMGVIGLSVAGWPAAGREQLLADLVHMQLNRTFRTDQREQELLVCFSLHKFLCSWKARRG